MENITSDFWSNLNWFDVGVLAVLLFSMVVGLIRGFFTQIAGILGAVIAVLVALKFSPVFGDWLVTLLPTVPTTSVAIGAFVALLLAVLAIWFVLMHFVKKLLLKLDFGTFDHVLGGAFGLVKGALFAYVLLVLINGVMPSESPINREFTVSRSSKGVEVIDQFIKKQKGGLIPDTAWKIIAALRRFDDEVASPAPASTLPGSGG